MAEKIPTSVPHIHRFRWLAVLPAVLSTIAFILQLCTVISGTQNGTLLGLDLMTVAYTYPLQSAKQKSNRSSR